MKANKITVLVVTLAASVLSASSTSVKEYQRAQLNDSEMELATRKTQKFETSFLLYREGASGANGGKNGGGCVTNHSTTQSPRQTIKFCRGIS